VVALALLVVGNSPDKGDSDKEVTVNLSDAQKRTRRPTRQIRIITIIFDWRDIEHASYWQIFVREVGGRWRSIARAGAGEWSSVEGTHTVRLFLKLGEVGEREPGTTCGFAPAHRQEIRLIRTAIILSFCMERGQR
jgi:hypothetical protein